MSTKMDLNEIYPRQKTGLVEAPVGEDLVLYDEETHRAFRLNVAAVSLWRSCDGSTPVESIVHAEDAAQWSAWNKLVSDGLITGVSAEPTPRLMSRRRMLLQSGGAVAAGAVVLPLVESILVPSAAAAASAMPNGNGNGNGNGKHGG